MDSIAVCVRWVITITRPRMKPRIEKNGNRDQTNQDEELVAWQIATDGGEMWPAHRETTRYPGEQPYSAWRERYSLTAEWWRVTRAHLCAVLQQINVMHCTPKTRHESRVMGVRVRAFLD